MSGVSWSHQNDSDQAHCTQHTKVEVISASTRRMCTPTFMFYRYGSNTPQKHLKSQHCSTAERLSLPFFSPGASPAQHFPTRCLESSERKTDAGSLRLPRHLPHIMLFTSAAKISHQVGSLGGVTDLHACCFQSFLLRLSGTENRDNSASRPMVLPLRAVKPAM